MAADSEPGILPSMTVNGQFGATAERRSFGISGTRQTTQAGSARVGRIALGLMLVTGVLISLAAAHTVALWPEFLDSSLDGPLGSISLQLPLAGVIAALVVMFASYVVVVRRADQMSPRAVLTTIVALTALMLLALPLFSTDVFSYQAYAREWMTYGANPYLTGPQALQLDPLYPYIGADWINTPTVYGPLFTMLSAPLASVSIAASVFIYKGVAALSCLTTVALIWHGSRLRGLNPTRAVALFGLNPLVVVYGVGGGHNDLLMLVLSTAAIYAMLCHREWTGGAVGMLATGVKLTAGLVLPFALASGARSGPGSGDDGRPRRSLLLGAGVVAAALAALTFSMFGIGSLNLILTLHKVQTSRDSHSIPGFFGSVLGYGVFTDVLGILLGLVFAYVFAKLLRRVWRGELDWLDGLGWATLALLVTASSVLPWYVSWLLPVVALSTDRRLWRWSLILSGVMLFTTLLGYIPHGDTFLGIPSLP